MDTAGLVAHIETAHASERGDSSGASEGASEETSEEEAEEAPARRGQLYFTCQSCSRYVSNFELFGKRFCMKWPTNEVIIL